MSAKYSWGMGNRGRTCARGGRGPADGYSSGRPLGMPWRNPRASRPGLWRRGRGRVNGFPGDVAPGFCPAEGAAGGGFGGGGGPLGRSADGQRVGAGTRQTGGGG